MFSVDADYETSARCHSQKLFARPSSYRRQSSATALDLVGLRRAYASDTSATTIYSWSWFHESYPTLFFLDFHLFASNADGPDVESAEMEYFMDSILHRSSTSTRIHITTGEDSTDQRLREANAMLAPTSRRRSSTAGKSGHVSCSRLRQESWARGSAADSYQQRIDRCSDVSKLENAPDDEDDETDVTLVVGKRSRRYIDNGPRRSSSGSNVRRNSNGILQRMQHGVSSIAPEIRRRSSSLLRQMMSDPACPGGLTTAVDPPVTGSGMIGLRRGTAPKNSTIGVEVGTDKIEPVAAGTGGAPEVGANGNADANAKAVRRASLLGVAMRSKAAAAAVDGNSYEAEADAEADEVARERAMSRWSLEFHDAILEKVGVPRLF